MRTRTKYINARMQLFPGIRQWPDCGKRDKWGRVNNILAFWLEVPPRLLYKEGEWKQSMTESWVEQSTQKMGRLRQIESVDQRCYTKMEFPKSAQESLWVFGWRQSLTGTGLNSMRSDKEKLDNYKLKQDWKILVPMSQCEEPLFWTPRSFSRKCRRTTP